MSIKIVTDSTCDLPPEVISRYGITIVPLFINMGMQSYLDGFDLTREEFYQRLPEYKIPPTTAAPPPEKFQEQYEELACAGATEILSLHISVSLSATVEMARLAAQRTTEVPVTVLDSQQLSLGTGFMAVTAAKSAEEGRSMPEILALLDEQMRRTHVFAALDTLEFLRRSGRMSFALATLGSLLRIKPLLRMYAGKPTSARARTRKGAIRRVVHWLGELAPLERVALLHTNAPAQAEMLRQQVKDILPQGEIWSVGITPVIGAHIGPGAVGFACITTPRL
jgi:DegV family protein with EDD domain